MAANNIIQESPSIKQAVSLINTIDTGRFPRLLSRILQKLHLKAERSFSEDEEEKLQAAFSLEKQDLHLVLETISFILEQAVYHNVKPTVLQQQLENINLDQEKAEAFASAWTAAGHETIEKFRLRSIAPKKLETTGWQLNLQMAQSTQAKMTSPRAVLELGVSTEEAKMETDENMTPVQKRRWSWTNRINITCICCSSRVETPENLKNRLCKDCVSLLDQDCEEHPVAVVKDITVACAICSKRFQKTPKQKPALCKECIAIILYGSEKKLGDDVIIISCCICYRRFAQSVARQNENMCPQCEYVINAPFVELDVQPGVVGASPVAKTSWSDTIAPQGYTSIVVKTYLKKYFYRWCEGHKYDEPGQEGHQCLETNYAENALRRVCYTVCSFMIVKMLRTMQPEIKLNMGKGPERCVSKTLWAIHGSTTPYLKLKQFTRGCPHCVRSLIEKNVHKWGNRLYQRKYRSQLFGPSHRLYFGEC